jgi:two-component system sensor histidine kinase/response regulator
VATILVVDDEAPIREFLALLLEDLGHEVRLAINGRQAVELASSKRPDLVISDVMMPVMGGPEFCTWVKRELHPPPPVILTSSAGRHLAANSPADAFIDKPFDIEEIEELVRRCLE